MSRIPLDIPVGLISNDTTHAAAGRYSDCSGIRWYEGRAQIRGGCEKLVDDNLTGVCRSIFNWTDTDSALNIAFGTHLALEVFVGGGLYDITPTLALPSALLPTDPLAVTNGSPTVTVTHAGHPLVTGDSIIVSGAAAVGGITPNGTFTVTVLSANSYRYTFGSNATGTATGGGSAVLISPQRAFTAGGVDGTGGQGYGTGTYSTGNYSEPSTADNFPRTWSLSDFGENLIANPRGGAIYAWTNNTGTKAAPLQNSPAKASFVLVSSTDQVFALGCSQEADGVFNPSVIRHSSIRNYIEWSTTSATTAREYTLPGGGRIIAGHEIGANLLIWKEHAVFLGTYVGSLTQPWRFDRIAEHCGLIGPNAAVVVGQRAFWLGPDLQFYAYSLGGAVTPVDCPIRADFADHVASGQGDKIVASSCSSYQEIRFDYPDVRDGVENSRYLTLVISGPDVGAWARGQGAWARTAYVDAGPAPYPISADVSGRALWQERGRSDDGGALSGFLETADQYIDETRTALVQGIWPDLAEQVGPINLSIISRFKPQGDTYTKGPVALAPGQGKADIRANGRLHRVLYEFNSAPVFCRWGKPLFDITLGGYR